MVARTLFICGCGHSGTSLLANMFAAHPKVHVPLVETRIFLRRNIRWNLTGLYLAAFRRRKRFIVEKTPRHLECLQLIRRYVRGARFVVMVRDGRDVAASFVKRYGNAEQGVDRWILRNIVARQERPMADVLIVRYEDLVVDPQGQLERICTFSGIPFDPAMLDYHKAERLWFGVKENRAGTGEDGEQHRLLRNWQVNQPIFDGAGAGGRDSPTGRHVRSPKG